MRFQFNWQTIASLLMAVFAITTFSDRIADAQGPLSLAPSDSQNRLPGDNVALFDPHSRQLTVRLNYFSGDQQLPIAGALVTIIRPDLETTKLISNASGSVTIDSVTRGVHTVTASALMTGGTLHGTIVVACQEAPVRQLESVSNIYELDFERKDRVGPVTMTLLKDTNDTVVGLTKAHLSSVLSQIGEGLNPSPLTSMRQSSQTSGSGPEFQNLIQLGKQGSLYGQLISPVPSGRDSESVRAMSVTVLRDGIVVGNATTDNQGRFQIDRMQPGDYGMVVSGQGGNAAFGFRAVGGEGLLPRANGNRSFAYAHFMNDGEVMPIALSPPSAYALILEAMESFQDSSSEHADVPIQVLAQDLDPSDQDIKLLKELRKSINVDPDITDGPPIDEMSNMSAAVPRLTEEVSDQTKQDTSETDVTDSVSELVSPTRKYPVNLLRTPIGQDPRVPVNPLRP